ncbi:MAG TPA: EamA family transporter [Solirubrobacterales bacterium]|nr:EamA family transporter [Solirubrobacterales bacterium]
MAPGQRTTSISLVLGGIVSVQVGAAVATELFDEIGPVGTVFLRLAFAAIVLVAIWRPPLARLAGGATRDVLAFGFALAAMNTSFYLALDRIPLGIAVTLEFVGPLGVAFALSRRRLDLVWAGLAAGGILLLSPAPGGDLDTLGVVLALVAGAFWAAYIVLSARIGRLAPGGGGLALAMVVGAVLVIPPGLADGGGELLDPGLLVAGFAVAMLSSAIPYSLELEALRRLPQGVFGVLMSLEPAVAAAVGFLILEQDLIAREIVAIALVVLASAGALRASPPAAEA